jgi:APA family basic amino acid/polyamine antiporter
VVLVSSYAGNLKGSLLGTGLILLGLPVLWVVRKIYPEPSAELEGISNS